MNKYERRFKRILIDPEAALNLFTSFKDNLVLHKFVGLPDDYVLLNIWLNEDYYFDFLIYHESFSIVNEGSIIPIFEQQVVETKEEEYRKVEPYVPLF